MTEPAANPDARIADIAGAGKIRAALFLPQFSRDENSNEITGHGTGHIGIIMARAFAARNNIRAEILGYPTPSSVVAAQQNGECDIAFMGIEPGRQAVLDFTTPMFQFDYTYLVAGGVSIATIPEGDRKGFRIVLVDNHASALALRPQIKHAQLVSAELPDEAFEMMCKGEAHIFACPRDVLLDYSAQLPGSRVLDDAFGINRVGISMRKGREELRAALTEFVEEAKASGLIGRTIEAGRLRGFTVAPPAAAK